MTINKASQAIQSPHTGQFFSILSLDGYSCTNVCFIGIVEFKHLKKCDLVIFQRPHKHEPVQDMCILNTCVK